MATRDALWTRPLVFVVVVQAVYGFGWSTFLLLPKFLATELNATPIQIGLVSAFPTLTAVATVPYVGRMIDAVGRKPLIAFGASLQALHAWGMLYVDSVGPLLFVLEAVRGIGFVTEFNAATALAADLSPPKRLGQTLGVFGAANVAMNGLSPRVVEPLIEQSGWSAAFGLSSAVCAVCAMLALNLRDVDGVKPVGKPAPLDDDARRRRLHDSLTMAAIGAAFAIVFTFYQPLAIERGATHVGGFFMGFATAVVFTRVVLGSVIDRWGRRRMGLVAASIYVVTIAAMSGLQPDTLPLYGLAFGCAHGLVYPALNALALEHARPGDRGRVIAWVNGGFQAGFTVSALGAGLLAQQQGYASVFTLGVVFSLAAWTLLYRRPSGVSPSTQSG